MFGFGNNPPTDIYEELARTAHSMAQLMFYIQIKKTLVPRTRQETPIDLTDDASREQVTTYFEMLVSDHGLLDLTAFERRDILNDLAVTAAEDNDTPQIYENTLTVLVAVTGWIFASEPITRTIQSQKSYWSSQISLLSKQFQLLILFFVMAIQKITDECGRICLA